MLINEIIKFCDKMYDNFKCNKCTGVNCNGKCKECLDDIHFHKNKIRNKYDCCRLLYYYVCRYSYKYSSELIYALTEVVDLSDYPLFNIISLGCGGGADLMAFDYIDEKKINHYCGFDFNCFWKPIHDKISNICSNAKFCQSVDVLSYFKDNSIENYNVIIIEYLISFFYNQKNPETVNQWYDNIIESIVEHRLSNSPMLIIINDADSINTGRDTFQNLVRKLKCKGINCSYKKMRFTSNSYYSNSILYKTNKNFFDIDFNFQQKYCVAEVCTSAQMIIEVR